MTESQSFTGRVTNNTLHVRAFKERFAMPDGEVLVTIERAHATRNSEANSLYWVGYVRPLAEYTGHTEKWMHAYLKARYLPKRRITIVDKQTGEVIDEVDLAALTTTTLTTNEFAEYLHDIADFAETLRVPVGSNRDAA